MNEGLRYKLEGKYMSCPSCGRKGKYRDYYDTYTNTPVANMVCGKCFSVSCGYNVTAYAYYQEHPDERSTPPKGWKPAPPPPTSYIDAQHVTDYMTEDIDRSNLLAYLAPIVGREALSEVVQRYFVGVDADGSTRWPQVDTAGRIREIKVQQHNRFNGHRAGATYMVHSNLRERNEIDPESRPEQCLFGLHLLADATADTTAAVVESEKTAVMCAAVFPDVVWLATGGSGNFRLIAEAQDRLRRCAAVIIYPDAGCFQKWREDTEQLKIKNVVVSSLCEGHPSNTDIADLLIYDHLAGAQQASTPISEKKTYFRKGTLFPEPYISPTSTLTEEEFHAIFLI